MNIQHPQPQPPIWELPTLRLPRIDVHQTDQHETIPMLIAFTRPLPKLPRRWQFVSVRKLFSRASHE